MLPPSPPHHVNSRIIYVTEALLEEMLLYFNSFELVSQIYFNQRTGSNRYFA